MFLDVRRTTYSQDNMSSGQRLLDVRRGGQDSTQSLASASIMLRTWVAAKSCGPIGAPVDGEVDFCASHRSIAERS
jgi:hypothetical protein